ncbi:coiled-coil domain-containing protein 172 [Nematolebias whitei]|uniref:coiled-coil domain-containing protein 172 n=1 Tax=Nematolebias whitei TaxID=451745 RepID=UPI00189A7A75|nr:coiled-coil domain-containing protein 172 [Nematolebias whitei]
MSLDSLFQQILLTEQQQAEQTQKFKDVKVSIIRCKERIKNATEKYEQAKLELDKMAQQLSTMRLQCDLTKKCEEQMLIQIEELLGQKHHLGEHLAKIRTESKEEEENFLQAISVFNSDFSLPESRLAEFESQTHTELLALKREVEALLKEMQLMRCRNSHVSSAEEEKKKLLLELQSLDNTQKDLDQQVRDARAMTESLRWENRSVSQKHLTDNTCLR